MSQKARSVNVSQLKLIEFNQEAYTTDEFERYLQEGEAFINELAQGLLQEGRSALTADIEEFIDKVFRNSSKRGSQVNRLNNGRVGPNRVKISGVKGPYPSIDQPIRIDRLHGADPNGLSSDVFVRDTADGGFEITVTNFVFNLLDRGRPAIDSKTLMKFPVYSGRRLQTNSVSLSGSKAKIQAGWVKTHHVAEIAPHNFLKTIVNNRRLKGSNWNRQMRRYQLKASKELESFPFELSFRFDDSLMQVEISE